jgi:hypothetical protein
MIPRRLRDILEGHTRPPQRLQVFAGHEELILLDAVNRLANAPKSHQGALLVGLARDADEEGLTDVEHRPNAARLSVGNATGSTFLGPPLHRVLPADSNLVKLRAVIARRELEGF